MAEETAGTEGRPPDEESAKALEQIAQALRGLRFGEVKVTVQDGVVIQLERTERLRLRRRTRK
jgi:hypothetical protein